MAGSTGRGIYYPTVGDDVDELHAVFATLASSVDTALANYLLTTDRAVASDVTTGTSTTKLVTPKSLVDAGVYSGDTGWVTISSSVSAGSGWAKGSGFVARARRVGMVVQLQVSGLEKSGSPATAVGVSGNIANIVVLSGVPAQFRPSQSSPLAPIAGGRANAYYIDTSGSVYLSAVVPNVNWTGTKNLSNGEGLSCGGTYFGA